MKTGAIALLALLAQAAPTQTTAPNPWGPIDNPRVHVWIDDGSPGVADRTAVAIVRVSEADGRVSYAAGAQAPGSPSRSSKSARTIEIDLKDAKVEPLQNTSGYPLAFPRPNVKKVLENDRVIVWDYTWTAGKPTPMHFHDKDVVVVYLADGALKSTDPKGATVINPHYYGFTKFNPRDRVHYEELASGKARAIIVELK